MLYACQKLYQRRKAIPMTCYMTSYMIWHISSIYDNSISLLKFFSLSYQIPPIKFNLQTHLPMLPYWTQGFKNRSSIF